MSAMRYLTIEQREALQSALGARAGLLRTEVAEALDQQDDGTLALANHSQETDDDAIVDLEASLDVARLSREVLELREIDRALARLHTPEYGQCADCGEDIPFIRLQANPMAFRCIGCQSAFERSHAQPGHPSL